MDFIFKQITRKVNFTGKYTMFPIAVSYKRKFYHPDMVEKALEAVIGEGVSFGQAALQFGVPKTTLYRKYKSKIKKNI